MRPVIGHAKELGRKLAEGKTFDQAPGELRTARNILGVQCAIGIGDFTQQSFESWLVPGILSDIASRLRYT